MCPCQTALALSLATLINVKVRGSQFFRTIFYAPSVTSSVVITMIFWWLYLKTGYLNFGLTKLWAAIWRGVDNHRMAEQPARPVSNDRHRRSGGNIPSAQWYLRGPSVTWMAIMFQNIFTTAPTFMIMFLAALAGDPSHLYTRPPRLTAPTHGSSFWRITVPMLRPVLLLVVVLGTIGTWQVFDQVKILTAGGPLDTTLVPVYLIYTEALGTNGPPTMGYASRHGLPAGPHHLRLHLHSAPLYRERH